MKIIKTGKVALRGFNSSFNHLGCVLDHLAYYVCYSFCHRGLASWLKLVTRGNHLTCRWHIGIAVFVNILLRTVSCFLSGNVAHLSSRSIVDNCFSLVPELLRLRNQIPLLRRHIHNFLHKFCSKVLQVSSLLILSTAIVIDEVL